VPGLRRLRRVLSDLGHDRAADQWACRLPVAASGAAVATRPIGSRQPENLIDLEEGAPRAEFERLRAALGDLGWETASKAATGLYFGGGNGVAVLGPRRLIAVADDRRTNDAAGD